MRLPLASKAKLVLLFSLVSGMLYAGTFRRFEFDIESGMAISGYNNIRIPNNTGTLISFSEELKTDPAVFIRGRVSYRFNKGNEVSILVAPLTLYAAGSVDREVVFEGESFAPNTPLEGVFRFNSYRLSYEHFWDLGDDVQLGLGVTGKIRDALVSIADSNHKAEKTNVGFVPLIRFSLKWMIADPLTIILEGDALASPQGRAEDVALAFQGKLNEQIALRLGYRLLEGGADVDEVYNFTWVNYILAGASLRF